MPNCSSVYTVSYETKGCALVVHGLCENSHRFYWTSSCQTANNNGDKLYEDNLLFATAVILSGKNYSKLEQFCKILNLYIIISYVSASVHLSWNRQVLLQRTG